MATNPTVQYLWDKQEEEAIRWEEEFGVQHERAAAAVAPVHIMMAPSTDYSAIVARIPVSTPQQHKRENNKLARAFLGQA